MFKKGHQLQIFVDYQEALSLDYKDLTTNALDSRLTTSLKLNGNQQITFVYNSFFYKENEIEVVQPQIEEEFHFETLSLDDFLTN